MEKIARYILIVYYTITGFFFYLKYLSHKRFNGKLFYSSTLGKCFRLKYGRTFVTNYAVRYLNFETFTSKEVNLTFRDLGLYKLKLKEK